jgi:hypothetical protein
VFNLIMQGAPWGEGRGTVNLSRVFEYTDDGIADRFRHAAGQPNLTPLTALPCLFMQEGTGDQPAYVGSINRARLAGQIISIEYSIDQDIPPLQNETIYQQKSDFDILHDFEFSRNHWAVKDVDLFRLLLRIVRPRRRRPTVFSISDRERIEPQLISVMIPFDAGFRLVFRTLRSAVERAGLRCRRADEIWENPAITQDIVSLIDRSRVVICDCTGRNPNVFYEIGIAHTLTLGREVILITQAAADIPFDLRHLRYVSYHNNGEGRRTLAGAIERRLNDLLDI